MISFDNSYANDLEGFYVPWQGDAAPAPRFLKFNQGLVAQLGLDASALSPEMLSGGHAPEGAVPLAMAYAGHQFGGFSPQLGDGRALLLGEVVDPHGARFDIHLKGSGKTPFSRGGDGKALIGPVLREYLLGEAMHALGVPTTRALAAVSTGETVMREEPQAGAVLARVASSHLRVGTFQFFAARGESARVKQLADYAIARHDPHLIDAADKYLQFLRAVANRQADLIAKWVALGFVHGVMNTDNVTISGETIDYGPCAFIDVYDPAAVFSSIDRNGRYALGNQAAIGAWNLARLAETLLELINLDDTDAAIGQATEVISGFQARYDAAFLDQMRLKLGLLAVEDGDGDLVTDLLAAMTGQQVDYTQAMRALADVVTGDRTAARGLFVDPTVFDVWADDYAARLDREADLDASRAVMLQNNPIYIPRNHLVEQALDAATRGDMAPFDALLARVRAPFTLKDDAEAFASAAPESFGKYVTFCGT